MPKNEKDQKKKSKSDDSASYGVYSDFVSAFNDKEAWCGGDRNLALIDKHGNVKRKIQLNKGVYDIAVTTENEIFVTGSTIIKKYLQDDGFINIADTQPYETRGLCPTSVQDEILVCLYDVININGKVVRMTTAGQIKQSIQKDKQQKLLYTYPRYVAENISGDVVVVDGILPSTILVVNKKGEYRYKYPDPSQSSHRIGYCYGLACDNKGCILVSDWGCHRIHQIDMDGRFIQFILTQQHGVQIPHGLSIDNKGQLWLCNNDGKEIQYYNTEQFCFKY
ncbi:hypothetical protein KUTeg_000836 [Tegillarca granosa]|uniref:Tripartite motif-containing protein 2 n=1 Tax=Tegillarca granosa TaxID=220873 RepID=A0ABQ9G2Z2_TEGGR|nr:hypothetical protein KUTeg_000836 [Tegillarca granosa]